MIYTVCDLCSYRNSGARKIPSGMLAVRRRSSVVAAPNQANQNFPRPRPSIAGHGVIPCQEWFLGLHFRNACVTE